MLMRKNLARASAVILACVTLSSSGRGTVAAGVQPGPGAPAGAPAAFSKTSPSIGAVGLNTTVTLQWSASAPTLAGSATRAGSGELAFPDPEFVLADPRNYFTRVGVSDAERLQSAPQAAAFEVTYNGFTPQAQQVFQAALQVWGALITSPVPIKVTANWAPLGTGVLGSAGAAYVVRNFNGAPQANTWYPAALGNKLAGSDLQPTLNDINATFNSNFTNWYYGTDGNPPAGQYDLMSVILHEVGHGLGFFGSATVLADGTGRLGSSGSFIIFDLFVVNGSSQPVTDSTLFPNPSLALAAQLKGNNLFWGGPQGRSANGGTPPKTYAPATWAQGSSYSHFDEAAFAPGNPNSLMTPFIGGAEAIHSPGPNTLGLFRDMGWTSFTPETVTYEYCVDNRNNNACDGAWISAGTATSVNVALPAGRLHFWQVRATTSGGTTEADGGTWARFSTRSASASPSDFNGNGMSDRTVFRPGAGTFFIDGQADRPWGAAGDVPVPGDYNGDRSIDAAVFRPSTGEWFLHHNQSTVQWGWAGDVPLPADFDGNGTTDVAVVRPGNLLTWFVSGQFTRTWGLRGDVPLAGDFDGDGRADLIVYRPTDATWHVSHSGSNFTTSASYQWGLVGDTPLAGDVDGDGRSDLTVFRPTGEWYTAHSSSGFSTTAVVALGAVGDVPLLLDVNGDNAADLTVFRPAAGTWLSHDPITGGTSSRQLGIPGDIPITERPRILSAVAGDFDGDGRDEISVFRPPTGTWYSLMSAGGFATSSQVQFGLPGDITVPGDYDGDRRADVAVFRPPSGLWFLRASSNGTVRTEQWGLQGDIPTPGDYEGDGRTDLAVYRPSTGQWFGRLSSTNYTTTFAVQWGLPTDTPMPADYDGDGRTDLAVFRPSTGNWHIRPSASVFFAPFVRQWGLPTDVPVTGDWNGDGRDDLVVYRPSSGQWLGSDAITGAFILNQQWGLSGDTPRVHDFDGDGRADFTVFRPPPGEWFALRSSLGFLHRQWGLSSDSPLSEPPGALTVTPRGQ
jgi:hypothetical protein